MDAAEELKALREEVAALRKEVAELRGRVIPNINVGAAAVGPHIPDVVQPLPMPQYQFQPYYVPNTSDAAGIWRYPTSAGGAGGLT